MMVMINNYFVVISIVYEYIVFIIIIIIIITITIITPSLFLLYIYIVWLPFYSNCSEKNIRTSLLVAHTWVILPFGEGSFVTSEIAILGEGYPSLGARTEPPLVNQQLDPENRPFLMVSLIFQPRWLPGSVLIYWRLSWWLTVFHSDW